MGSFTSPPSSGWYRAILDPAVNADIHLGGLTPYRLRFKLDDDNNNVADYIKFFRGDYATASYRPVLTIQYYVASMEIPTVDDGGKKSIE